MALTSKAHSPCTNGGTTIIDLKGKAFRRWLHLAIGLAVAGLFLYLAVRNVDLAEARSILFKVEPGRMLPLVAMSLALVGLRVWRWLLMFPCAMRPTRYQAFDAFALASLANSFMPGRLGDIARAGIIGRHVPALGASGAFATVVLEKVLDGLAVLLLLATALWLVPLPPWLMKAGAGAAAVFLIALALLFALGSYGNKSRESDPTAVTTKFAPVQMLRALRGLFHRFTVGLSTVTSVEQLTLLLLMSLMIWCAEVWWVYLCLQIFAIGVPPQAAVVTIVLLAVGTMLPAAPGFVGTYQFFVVTALAIYGVAESPALALSVFMNLFAMSMTVVVGAMAILARLWVTQRAQTTAHHG
ncbi:lysylphosphatidylglycerol synthase transmembrane domain-containing protein [Accumulibacter sp.]|uniref:lysylphosphatidylglycerol synthase transmembrane domain-containing protein n=1 Tax=Accumulibacter sp. TaxID=2053492 RepID=UPI0035B17745